jgi:phage tail-like protein
MAVLRDRPYPGFNFLVDFGTGDPQSVQAGFQEVSGLAIEIATIEYRNGNSRENAPVKLPGLAKFGDVTLRRGIIGSLDLYQWLLAQVNGQPNAARTVVIHLLNEDRSEVAQTWRLQRARIVKHVSGPLHARGNDVAIEEIVIAAERIELE